MLSYMPEYGRRSVAGTVVSLLICSVVAFAAPVLSCTPLGDSLIRAGVRYLPFSLCSALYSTPFNVGDGVLPDGLSACLRRIN